LRGYAELDKKLVLVGRTQRLEIWSEDNWNAEREKSQETYRSMLIDKRQYVRCPEKSILVRNGIVVTEHTTVLLKEAVDALVTDADGFYVDGTFGRGGHTAEFSKTI